MPLENHLDCSTAELERLFEWVKGRMKGDHSGTKVVIGDNINITEGDFSAWMTMFMARLGRGQIASGVTTTVGNVYLVFDKGRPYPYTSTYIKSVGPITVNTWQEEFIVFMAHELYHVEQYRRHGEMMVAKIGKMRSEYFAERHAAKVIKLYRKDRLNGKIEESKAIHRKSHRRGCPEAGVARDYPYIHRGKGSYCFKGSS